MSETAGDDQGIDAIGLIADEVSASVPSRLPRLS